MATSPRLSIATADTSSSAERAALASFALPVSPVRSAAAVWLEPSDDDGEQRARPPSPLLSADSSSSSSSSSDALDFPLVLCDAPGSGGGGRGGVGARGMSSALVPFQKLQLDTNLNRTLLPYKQQQQQAAAATGPGAVGSESGENSAASPSARAKKPNACAWDDTETSALMASEFMHALRLGDLSPPRQEPQLAVRLRGSRVELASASEEEDVDFLGPAENIKKLFKLPYSQARVSLAVHRVGSTLVVDGELRDADLPAGFEEFPQETMTIQQSEELTQSLLYEKFIYESAVQGRLTMAQSEREGGDARAEDDAEKQPHHQLLPTAHHSRQQPKAKGGKKSQKKAKKRASGRAAALSPLLTSAEHPGGEEAAGFALPDASWLGAASDSSSSTARDPRSSAASSASSAPYSSPSDRRSGPHQAPYSQAFQRILKWKFHDLKMILGSQVLLFSNKEHPAVSLKLHDMDTDLSLCTVLDYYLDNVIANIPELAICMHSKGLVRGYKLVETRQIPYMSGTGRPLFDIQDVSMNASMLLKFLQENCSRPNGTYWLYRKEGENSLRLYDVNVLSEGKQLKWKYMMAMLCYRFASRASRLVYSLASDTPRLQRQLQQRQRELLSTCMKLLREISQGGGSAHSSICSSVSEQLADTYLRECDHVKRSTSGGGSSSFSNPEDSDDDLKVLLDSLQKAKEHLLESIRSFEECMVPEHSGSSLPHEEDETDPELKGDGDEEEPDDGEDMNSFMDEERSRLQLKCASVYLQLGQVHAKNRSWTEAVSSIIGSCEFLPLSAVPSDVAPFSTTSVKNNQIDDLLESLDFDGIGGARLDAGGMFICSKGSELRCRVLELVGDIAAQLPTNMTEVLHSLYRVVGGEQRESLLDIKDPTRWSQWMDECQRVESSRDEPVSSRFEELLSLSFNAYLRALSPCVDSELYFMLMKKLGNASNELGKFYLGSQHDYVEAFRWFERGCKIFSEIEDGINVALLYANLAHLHKILAQGKNSAQARQSHYQSAIQLCNDALQQLRQNKAELELHRKVKGELALTYLVWAVSMANDFSSDESLELAGDTDATTERDSKKQRENEVHKTFNKALSLYIELEDLKQVASTHYQMASFHSRTISRDLKQQHEEAATPERSSLLRSATLKNRMEIARRHYEKALAYFGKVEVGKTFVLIHHELADLYAIGGRVEDVEHALLVMLNTYDAFSNPSVFENAHQCDHAAMLQLASEVIAKVKLILHQLIRLSSNGSNSSSSSSSAAPGQSNAKRKKLEMFKKMYKEAIYYDGHKGSGIAPMLGTLRSMYLL